MPGRNALVRTAIALVVVTFVASGCGGGGIGGSPASNNVPHPLVRQFSPTMSPIDFTTGVASPTYTDGMLTQSTDARYPGKICVFFQQGTKIDPKTVFISGNPALGIDLSALQIMHYTPGVGNVPLQPASDGVLVLDDAIIFTPATLPLSDGQYSIGVFANLKSVEGDPVDKTPVFMSFTVGTSDTIPPVVVVTSPVQGAVGVGAGVAPPTPPSGVTGVADVRGMIFGPTSPDIVIRFSESIASASVNANTITVRDAGSGSTNALPPAVGFPKLKSELDGSSLPSNGFEAVWRCDPKSGGLPFGTQISVTVLGADQGPAPIMDRSGNMLQATVVFTFQTIAPPKLPANPEPAYAMYWSAIDRWGELDTINQKEIALVATGKQTTSITRNVLPDHTDQIATTTTLGGNFSPLETSVDCRVNGSTCHTFAYVQSFNSGQVIIINTRNSLPVAIINTPSPGGLSNQTGGGQSANVLVVTNSSANTMTVFDVSSITTGQSFLDQPIFISQVNPTGNTPRAVSITVSGITGSYYREAGGAGPGQPLIMYADFTDGVVNTANLGTTQPIRQIALGAGAAPNDISLTPCFSANPILFGAISEGAGGPGDGKVAYYIAGPGCVTGTATGARPDSLVGDLSGFDGPSGLDCTFSFSPTSFFAVAESGSTSNEIVTLGVQTGAVNLPKIVEKFTTGPNPVAIAHRPAILGTDVGGTIIFPYTNVASGCYYTGTFQQPTSPDGSGAVSVDLYVAVRGAGRVEQIDSTTGQRGQFSPIAIPGIRYIASTCSQ